MNGVWYYYKQNGDVAMRTMILLLCMCGSSQAVGIPIIAGALSIASSSGSIVKEGHDLVMHFKPTMRKHGRDLKAALKGKSAPRPSPVTAPDSNNGKL
jgi:hypothetical protein